MMIDESPLMVEEDAEHGGASSAAASSPSPPPAALPTDPLPWSKRPAVLLLWSSMSSMGIVFGDLGTSPIYAFRQCFADRGLAVNEANVYGVLSMIIYSVVLVVTCKYLFILCFVESKTGAGGTLALVGRLNEEFPAGTHVSRMLLVPVSMVAISLFLADSLVTPGMSVLSAIEGLESLWPSNSTAALGSGGGGGGGGTMAEMAASGIAKYCPVIAIVVLALLYYSQRFGTGRLGGVFGPIMLAYFLVIGSLGLSSIALVGNWSVFRALNPFYSGYFVWTNPRGAWFALQSVILAITGAEALYSDMGHFGRKPIQLAWQAVVLPCLVFNYLGQGAIVLDPTVPPELQSNPFFALAPLWSMRLALIALSTCATLIGSQAVISGAFSVLEQAIQLDMMPCLQVVRTTKTQLGQIYIPAANAFLGAGGIMLVAIFRRSSNLASAYGLAVCGAMLCDSLLLFPVLSALWKWRLGLALVPVTGFLLLDAAFVSGALLKVPTGGWIPLCLAGAMLFVISTWVRARRAVHKARRREERHIHVPDLEAIPRMRGTGVYFSRRALDGVLPWCLDELHRKLGSIHERNVLVTMRFDQDLDECVCRALGDGDKLFEVAISVRSATEDPDVASMLVQQLPWFSAHDAVYYLFREQPVPRSAMSKVHCDAFRIMLSVGHGRFAQVLGERIMDRAVEMVRRVRV